MFLLHKYHNDKYVFYHGLVLLCHKCRCQGYLLRFEEVHLPLILVVC